MTRRRNGDLDYAAVHNLGGKGGRQPRGVVSGRLYYGPAAPIGEIRAVSYASDKEEAGKVYRHEFEQHDGRGPMLMMEAEGGADRVPNAPGELVELGHLLDFELANGERVIVAGSQLAISSDGERLVITSSRDVPLQVEQRKGAHVVTEHGIEG